MLDTTTDPHEEHRKQADLVLSRALALMAEMGIPFAVIMDRLFTVAGAHAVAHVGSIETADDFRAMAANIEGGVFDHLEPSRPARH